MKTGRVYLIGAGPGDPTLISVRGQHCLSAADVVVYDHRVHPRQLRAVRPDAERIDVGTAAPQPLEHDAIGYLLMEKAREGKTVVRLKWGDPLLFDSGGREAAFLRGQGVPFEIVPGIPHAVGGACCAGIPLTYPGAGDVLVFIRGHEGQTESTPDVDWAHVAPLGGTVVSHAGGIQLETIIDELLAHGRPASEPAALIIHGTAPRQRTVRGSLGELQHVVRDAQRRGSGVLVVGPVVRFRERLQWFENRPLFGRRVLVTRAQEQAAELVDRLAALGAEPIEAPTIRIVPPDDHGPLDAACAAVDSFDWIVLTSVNGVESFMRRLLAGPRDVRSLSGVKLCAIGPATAARLERYGLKVDLMPDEHRAEAVFDALREADDLAGRRVLLPRADLAREALARALREAGADVTEATAYRTVLDGSVPGGGPDPYKLLLDQALDVVTFTSASTVRNFVRILGTGPAADLLGTTCVAAIGPVTAAAAKQLGIETRIMPPTYTIPALVDAIADHFAGTRS